MLTPAEADEVLGMLRDMVVKGELTILMITHKFREVMAFADEVTILRRGKLAGAGKVIIPVAILLGGISASGGLLQRRLGLPDASVLVLQGIIFVFVLASDALYGRIGF